MICFDPAIPPLGYSLDKKLLYVCLREKISQQHCDCYNSHKLETMQYPPAVEWIEKENEIE